MVNRWICDVCGKDINEKEPKTICEYDACDECSEIYVLSMSSRENLKALITSAKRRRAKLGKPKKTAGKEV